MSLIKRAIYPGVRDGESLVHAIRPGEQVKTASSLGPGVQDFIGCLRPDPRYTYTLVNAMGSSWYFGPNSNKDWYGYNPHLDFDGLLHAWPDIGANLEADRAKGKGWPYGYPCFYSAAVYAHHKNTDPQQLGFGDVVFASFNPVMKRVELVMRVHNEEAVKKGHTSILERVRAGERVDVSMGAKVPFDLCSVCSDWGAVREAWKTYDAQKHRHPGVAILAFHRNVRPIRGLAITRADYCEHMLTMGGKILPDGRQVFVYNDFPRFFDISFVWIGADRTARVMWHLSEGDLPRGGAVAAPATGVFERVLRQLLAGAPAIKMAAMEKEIPDGIAQAVHSDADTMPELDSTMIRVVTNNPKRALSTLAALGIVLTPGEFQRMALGERAFGGGLSRAAFDTEVASVDDAFAVDPTEFDPTLAHAFSPLMRERSAFAPFLSPRLLSAPKLASKAECPVVRNAVMDKVGAQYNGYRLSILEHAPSLFPRSVDYLEGDPFLQDKIASTAAVAGLLLGLAPVIHLVSSHLRQRREAGTQLGSMANFVASNPSLTSVATIGGLLRAAIEVSRAGGLVQAAKTVFGAIRKMF